METTTKYRKLIPIEVCECDNFMIPCNKLEDTKPELLIRYPNNKVGFHGSAIAVPIWLCGNCHNIVTVDVNRKNEEKAWQDAFDLVQHWASIMGVNRK
jgi:hypothetical protein